jgi:hypothetical protein
MLRIQTHGGRHSRWNIFSNCPRAEDKHLEAEDEHFAPEYSLSWRYPFSLKRPEFPDE